MNLDFNQDWQAIIDQLIAEPKFWYGVFGIILTVYIFRQLRTRKDINLFNTEGGRVTVSRSALIALLKKACIESCPDSSPKVKLSFKKGSLSVKIKLRVHTAQNIQALSTYLQSKIHTILTEDLNFQQVAAIDILLKGFIPNKPKNTQESKTDSEAKSSTE